MSYFDEYEEHPFETVNKFICEDCLIDPALNKLAHENLTSQECSYCLKRSDTEIACSFDIIMERVYYSVSSYYGDAQDLSIPWDGGWAFSETDIGDIIYEFDPGWSDDLRNDITDYFGCDKYWVSHVNGDWGLSNPTQMYKEGWRSFCETVTKKVRYLFLTEPDDEVDSMRPDYLPVSSVLNAMGSLVMTHNLVSKISEGTLCYRVRALQEDQQITEFTEISVPPAGIAASGRMNAAGIPYLYVALDEDTAVKETITEIDRPYALATLTLKNDLRLLDLTKVPDIPSLFDPDKYEARHELYFLRAFREEVSKPISKDGKEHIDYVPTQIVSEYFRYRYLYEGCKLDGLIFNSSKSDLGKNLTLFTSKHEEVEEVLNLERLEHPVSNDL
ncbi:MAG: HEPN-associated N-terminal domain-containing protein [Lentisphaeraceae bacterium]|nr:HEPN-associated N-terminal domain-containing protein [Lentisphaeraceae bacterium]